jgi:hypothetical protein
VNQIATIIEIVIEKVGKNLQIVAQRRLISRHRNDCFDPEVGQRENEKPSNLLGLAATYSPTSSDAVPSALQHLTAGFGMGTGCFACAMTTKPKKSLVYNAHLDTYPIV